MTDTIIFDLDGTLLDTLEDLWASVNYSLAQNNMPLRSKAEVRSFLGNGAQQLIKLSLPEGVDAECQNSTFQIFKTYYSSHSMINTLPYPDVIDMLSHIKHNGYKTAIVSNKPDFAVQHLYKLFFNEYIDIAIGETSGVKRKPAPDMIIQALKMLGSEVESSIYIGDSEVDMATASNGNMRCISVSWGFRDRDYLESIGCKHIIDNPRELFNKILSI